MYGSDWLLSGYSFRQWIADSITTYGSAPHWNPNVFAGLPVRNPYTLFTLFYLIAPVHLVWTYLFVAAAFLAGLGAYLYLKELKLPLFASFLGGVGYMGCGSLLSMTQPGHDGKIMAAALFPIILLLLHKAIRRRRLTYFLFAGGLGGICAIHAHFQLTYYAGVVCAFYLLCHLIWERRENGLIGTLRLAVYGGLGLVLAGAVGMVKFLPIFGAFGWGSRGGIERGYEFATSWSLPPLELIDLLTPHFSGILGNYWGANYFRLDTHYLGILPLLLALLGVIFKFRDRYVKFFLGVAVLGTLFSLGGYTPFYRIPYHLLPQVSKFRAPSMAFYLTAFAVIALAGYGLLYLLENRKSPRRLALPLAMMFGGVLIFTLICIGAQNSITESLKSHLELSLTGKYGSQLVQQKVNSLYQNYPDFLKGLGLSLFLVGLNSILIVLLILRKLKLETLIMLAFTGVLLFDQWSVGKRFLNVESHPDRYYAPDGIVNALRAEEEDVYRVFPLMYEHSRDAYLMLHGFSSVGGYVANPYRRYQELIGAGKSVMFQPSNLLKYENIMDILSVTHVISMWLPDDLSEYDENTRQMIENFKLDFVRQWGATWEDVHRDFELVYSDRYGRAVFRNPRALPPVWAVSEHIVQSETDALRRLKEPDFDPRKTVILEEDPSVSYEERTEAPAAVTIREYEPNRIECDADLAAPAFVVFSENWHPDWKAYVDGVETKLHIADYNLRAVFVGSGKHTVELVYDSVYLKAGAWTSSASLLFLLGVGIRFFLRRRSRKAHKT